MTTLERLIEGLSRLPGLGRKSAARLAYHFLVADEQYVRALASDLIRLKESTRPCPVCGVYAEDNACQYCDDGSRDTGLICVVEESRDVLTIEQTHEFRGQYHVLMGAISPIDGIGPKDLRIDGLYERVRTGGISEVILATNPTVEGETTAVYLKQRLQDLPVQVSQLALGLPVGGDIEYADRLTLTRALRGRTRL